MQRGRNLLILLVLGLGLTYVYFVEMKREPDVRGIELMEVSAAAACAESRKKGLRRRPEAAKIEELRLTSSIW